MGLPRLGLRAAARPMFRRTGSVLLNLRFRAGQAQMLFVIGHMRSGSSLLVHLLVDHPAIIGFGETKTTYTDTSDYGSVAYRVYRSFGRLWPRERYVVDKVLHDEFGPDARLLDDARSRTIFLLRDPRQALPSILGRTRETRTAGGATAYYIRRLDGIQAIVETIRPDRWAFLTYGRLLSDTDPTLAGLQAFLDLDQHLDGTYEPIWATGRKGIGDDSDRIGRGRIVRDRRRDRKAAELERFTSDQLRRASSAFEETVARLESPGSG